MKKGYATPTQSRMPEVGETALSAVIIDGNVYVVDQHGKMVQGLINCSVHTGVDECSTIKLTCYAQG